MRNGPLKKAPNLETEEEAAQFWLTHDTTDYVDMSKMVMPNRLRVEHFVQVPIPSDEYGQLSELAAARKKTLAEMIGLILQSGLREMRVNPSARS